MLIAIKELVLNCLLWSYVMQIVGTIVLGFNLLPKSIIINYNNDTYPMRVVEHSVYDKKQNLRQAALNFYINWISLINIVAGITLSIFADNDTCVTLQGLIILLFIIMLYSLVLYVLANILALIRANIMFSNIDKHMPNGTIDIFSDTIDD